MILPWIWIEEHFQFCMDYITRNAGYPDIKKVCSVITQYVNGTTVTNLQASWSLLSAYTKSVMDNLLDTDAIRRENGWINFIAIMLFMLFIVCIFKYLFPFSGRKKKEVFCKQVQGDVYDLAKTAYKPGHTELVKFLVEEQSIDVNHVVSDAGMTLFLCACVSGQKRLVNFMLDRGANIHSKTSDGDSALYLATFAITNSDRMDITLIELLIKAGCDVNGQNYNGNTALHRAAMKGNPVLIKTLLDYDADPYISNNELILPIDCAINAGHIGVAQILKINIISENDEDGDSPYTPTRIKLGLQSPPYKNHLVESTFHHKKVILS